MSYNFLVPVIDTDSLTVCKADGSEFAQSEIDSLTTELNDLFDELINWEFEFYIPNVIVVKSKNYILDYGNGKIILKGSSIKDQKKEPALREMMERMIKCLIYDKVDELPAIYKEYVKEAMNVKNIHRWCQKKNISRSVLDCEDYTEQDILDKKLGRAQTNIWDAVKGIEGLQEGDKVYLYPVILGNKITPGGVSAKTGKPLKDKVKEITGLRLEKEWKGDDEDKIKLVERVFATVSIFSSILDMENFLDYSTKTNREQLEALK